MPENVSSPASMDALGNLSLEMEYRLWRLCLKTRVTRSEGCGNDLFSRLSPW